MEKTFKILEDIDMEMVSGGEMKVNLSNEAEALPDDLNIDAQPGDFGEGLRPMSRVEIGDGTVFIHIHTAQDEL